MNTKLMFIAVVHGYIEGKIALISEKVFTH